MYNVIMQYLNSFLSCSIRNLTSASLSPLFTVNIDVFPIFTSFNSRSDLYSMKAITEHQLYDFLVTVTVDIPARNIFYTIEHYEGLQSS